MDRRPSKPRNLRAGAPKSDVLNPDVIDDETRKLLLEELHRPVARLPTSSQGVQQPQQQQQPVTPTSPPKSPGRRQAGGAEGGAGYPAHFRARVNSNASTNANDVVAAMAARLAELEKRHKNYQSELGEMRTANRKLSDGYQKEKNLREEAENLLVTLYEEKKALEEELGDIKQFLADYGLHWRGKAGESTSQTPSRSSSAQVTPRAKKGAKEVERGGKLDLYEGDFEDIPSPSEHPPEERAASASLLHPKPQQAPQLYSGGPGANGRTPTPAYSSSSPPDVELLKTNARILSDYVGWKGVVVTDGKKAVIKDRDVVTLVVYKNGICVNKGVFRPYGWALCDAFLKDLVEGFYPYEFKDKYPDGFPIEVVDRSLEACEAGVARAGVNNKASARVGSPSVGVATTAATAAAAAAAGGRRLGGPSPSQPANVHSLDDGGREKGYAPLTKDEFLARLPAQRVTPTGQLVNVRNGVADVIGGRSGSGGGGGGGGGPRGTADVSCTIKHVSAAEAVERAGEGAGPAAAEGGNGRVRDFVAVLIRLPSGQKVTLNVPPTATIGSLREELAAAVPDFVRQNAYELCQAFPDTRVLSDRAATLQSLGITRSCTLMIRLLKTAKS